eukprot:117423-Hanusia_phi.AAC.2
MGLTLYPPPLSLGGYNRLEMPPPLAARPAASCIHCSAGILPGVTGMVFPNQHSIRSVQIRMHLTNCSMWSTWTFLSPLSSSSSSCSAGSRVETVHFPRTRGRESAGRPGSDMKPANILNTNWQVAAQKPLRTSYTVRSIHLQA